VTRRTKPAPQQGHYRETEERLQEVTTALSYATAEAGKVWTYDDPVFRQLRAIWETVMKFRVRLDNECVAQHGVLPSEASPYITLGGADLAEGEIVRDGQFWGPWEYKATSLVLDYKNGQYEVDLERCNSSAEILDWIVQVAGKSFITEADLGHLIRALDDLACSLQSKVCGLGHDKRFAFAEHLRKVTL